MNILVEERRRWALQLAVGIMQGRDPITSTSIVEVAEAFEHYVDPDFKEVAPATEPPREEAEPVASGAATIAAALTAGQADRLVGIARAGLIGLQLSMIGPSVADEKLIGLGLVTVSGTRAIVTPLGDEVAAIVGDTPTA